MAKAIKTNTTSKKKQPPPQDITLWFSTLSWFPPELKNSLWMASAIFYAKKNALLLLDPTKAVNYRALNRLEINRQDYVNLIDPPTPQGSGGTASYFSSDFKANPISIHLDNIMKADILQDIPSSLTVNVVDPVAKTQQQKDNDKVIYQRVVREMINSVWRELGIMPLSESQDPYKYVQQLQNQPPINGDGQQPQSPASENDAKAINALPDIVGYIRNQIRDSQDLMLYNTYIYKSDIEKAFELGIQHYLLNQNKWKDEKGEHFLNDIKNFNIASGRIYIDETTGRQIVRYIDPATLYTSPFKSRNGEDIMYFFHEDSYSFADFVRMFGAQLNEEQLKEVFMLNKQQGSQHGLDWEMVSTPGNQYGSNALITVGFFSILTQDTEKFSEGYVTEQNTGYVKVPNDWSTTPDSLANNDGDVSKTYNVWYSCYYIPPPATRLTNNAMADYKWQSQYIFNIRKDIDAFRYGQDLRYAKPQLVIWRDFRPSFTDIEQAYMPKIHTLWHKFQNCLIQDTVGLVMDDGFLNGMLEAVDEANKDGKGNGKDAAMQQWKQLRQSGMSFLRFRDKNGNVILDPSKLFVYVDTKHVDKAERYLQLILNLYQQMTLALAFSDQAEGQEGAPRVSVEAIQAAITSSNKGRWFIEHAYSQICIMFAERVIKHIHDMAKESQDYNFNERWNEFQDVVGKANALELEGVADIHLENIGITVSDEDTKQIKSIIDQLALQMVNTKELNYDILGIILSEKSWKYAYSILVMGQKQQAREAANQQELEFERQMQLGQQQLQTALALKGAEAQGINSNIQTQGQINAQLDTLQQQQKNQYMQQQKQQLLANKLIAAKQQSNLKIQESQATNNEAA